MARSIRRARPRGVAIVGHDVLRREILHVRDHPGALSVPYIDMSARFALDHGLDVIIEGILHAEIYGETLTRLCGDHLGITRAYYYELELGEMLRRHRTKTLAAEVTEEQVKSWYLSRDCIDGLGELSFDASFSEHEALKRVLVDVGWSAFGEGSRVASAGT